MIFIRLSLLLACLCIGQYLLVHSAAQFFSESYIYDATELTKRDRYAQGEQAALRAARLNSQNGYAQYQIASNRYLLDKYDDAARQATRALPLMPHRANLLRLRGECLFQAHVFDGAAADLLGYFALVPDPPVNPGHLLKIAGISLYQLQRAGEATYWLNRAAAYASSTVETRRLKADTSLLLNDPVMAANAIVTVLNRAGGALPNGVELLKNAMLAQRVPVLVSALENAVGVYATSAPVVQTLAAAYIRSGNPESALGLLKNALAANDTNADLHFMLGDLLYQQKNFPEAAVQYDRVLTLQPDSPYKQDIERRKAEMR